MSTGLRDVGLLVFLTYSPFNAVSYNMSSKIYIFSSRIAVRGQAPEWIILEYILQNYVQIGEYIEFVLYALESRSIWKDITSTKMLI